MPRELLTLKEWARSIYGPAAPSMGTLRRWAREGCITPPAEKHGRTYFVVPDARYVDYQALKADAKRRAREAGKPAPGRRLLERLIHGEKT